jgi:hypothetical protein
MIVVRAAVGTKSGEVVGVVIGTTIVGEGIGIATMIAMNAHHRGGIGIATGMKIAEAGAEGAVAGKAAASSTSHAIRKPPRRKRSAKAATSTPS